VNILASHFSLAAQIVTWSLFVIAMAIAIWRAPWYHLRDSQALNILLGMVVGVMVIWMEKAGVTEGLSIHLLGTTLLTLMFGWAFAIMGIFIVLVAHTILAGSGWTSLPIETLILGVVPAIVSFTIFRIVDRRLPNNFFVYIFLNAFFGAALAVASAVFATTIVYIVSDVYPADEVWHDYTRFALLTMFPEAFVTGMLMSMFVVYRPECVSTFDDSRYLKGK
jgi:uncharacterized membrane protein